MLYVTAIMGHDFGSFALIVNVTPYDNLLTLLDKCMWLIHVPADISTDSRIWQHLLKTLYYINQVAGNTPSSTMYRIASRISKDVIVWASHCKCTSTHLWWRICLCKICIHKSVYACIHTYVQFLPSYLFFTFHQIRIHGFLERFQE